MQKHAARSVLRMYSLEPFFGNTVMDNDDLTSMLVILVTNLLNNHCP